MEGRLDRSTSSKALVDLRVHFFPVTYMFSRIGMVPAAPRFYFSREQNHKFWAQNSSLHVSCSELPRPKSLLQVFAGSLPYPLALNKTDVGLCRQKCPLLSSLPSPPGESRGLAPSAAAAGWRLQPSIRPPGGEGRVS